MGLTNADESKIIRIPKLNYVPDPRGLGYVYFTHMLKHGEKIAQIDTIKGGKDKFSSLLQRCIRTAICMRSKGVKPGDIISICSFNHLNSCVPYIATLFLGAQVANLDPTISLEDTVHLLKQGSPKMIFVMPEGVDMIQNAIKEASLDTEIIVFGRSDKYTSFEVFLQPQEGEADFKPVEVKSLRDTAMIYYSSGTSGLPKGICIDHFAFLNHIEITNSFASCYDVMLVSTSLYWITAGLFLGISMIFGGTRLVIPRFEVTAMLETIRKYKPTYMFAAPSQLLMMYNHARPYDLANCSLKQIVVGGGPVLKDQIEFLRKGFPKTRILIGYGQTEAAGFLTIFKLDNPKEVEHVDTKAASCGTGVPGFSYKVVDPETEELLGPNQQGEIRFTADCCFSSYHNLNTADAYDSEGWIKSGDIGYYDEDHCFYVVDRIKEMLKFQSWHVPPAIIENVLLTHPDVANAVVIGIPHEIDGDHPMAVVALKSKSNGATAEEIEQFVEEKVHDRQRLRAGVKIVAQVPTTPVGKIKRRDIRDMVLKGHI